MNIISQFNNILEENFNKYLENKLNDDEFVTDTFNKLFKEQYEFQSIDLEKVALVKLSYLIYNKIKFVTKGR